MEKTRRHTELAHQKKKHENKHKTSKLASDFAFGGLFFFVLLLIVSTAVSAVRCDAMRD